MRQQRANSLLVSLFSLPLLLFDVANAVVIIEDHSFLRHQGDTRFLKGQKKEAKRKKLILIICLAVGVSILFCGILVIAVWYYHRHYLGGGLTHIAIAVADAINGESASIPQSPNYHCQENNGGTIAFVRAIPLSSYHQRQISYHDAVGGSGSSDGAVFPPSQKCVSNGQQVGGQSSSSSNNNNNKTKHYVTRRPPR